MQIIDKVAEEDSPVEPSAVVAAAYDMDTFWVTVVLYCIVL